MSQRAAEKKSRREQLAEERLYRHLAERCGYVDRGAPGADFYTDFGRCGVRDGWHVAKAGDTPLTEEERKMQKKYPDSYTVWRVEID